MRRLWTITALCAALAGAASAGSDESPWQRLLAAAGLTRETCRFDLRDMAQYGGGDYRLAFFDAVHQDPLRIPFYARITRQGIAGSGGKLAPLVTLAALRTGDGTRLDLLGDPRAAEAKEADKSDGFLAAVREIHRAAGSPMPDSLAKTIASGQRSVPADVRAAAALMLRASARAWEWRKRSLAGVRAQDMNRLWRQVTAYSEDDPKDPAEDRLLSSVDRRRMLVGAELLAFALDAVRQRLGQRSGTERFTLDIPTPLGEVRLRGAQNDKHEAGTACLLILDTGGNDIYRSGGATAKPGHGISVLVDVAGDDRYITTPALDQTAISSAPNRKALPRSPAFGCGVLGYGMVADFAGNDIYRSAANTQGSAAFGAGVLADWAGDDIYDCHVAGQASALGGVGVLLDGGGKDAYRCFSYAQGYGSTAGCGILADLGSDDDTYEANDTVLDFPSPQSAQHNVSMAQGAGYGRRADYTDGHSLAGGIGILMDAGGSNTFTCGVFGQGVGYWYGLGMLLTGRGADNLTGQWYVQGAAAHFAVGILDDEGGNDTYTAHMNMAQGAGHDFSIGFLTDRAGNDRYAAPNLSLGGGNANGLGFLWDRSGDDVYSVRPSITRGRSSAPGGGIRERNLTLGLFLDTGGKDTYPGDIPAAANGALWTMGPADTSSRGAGLDAEAPETGEPG